MSGDKLRKEIIQAMDECYTKEGSTCELHLIFQLQKAVNLIMDILSKNNVGIIVDTYELPHVSFQEVKEHDEKWAQSNFTDSLQEFGKKCQKDLIEKHGFRKVEKI